MVPTPDRSPPPCMAPMSPSFRRVECCRVWCAAYCWSYWVSGEGHVQVRAPRVRPLQFAKPNQTLQHNTIPNSATPCQTKQFQDISCGDISCAYCWFYRTIPYRPTPNHTIPCPVKSVQWALPMSRCVSATTCYTSPAAAWETTCSSLVWDTNLYT